MDDRQLGKIIDLPFQIPEGKTWLPPRPEPLGQWTAWSAAEIKGWTLKLHPVFDAQVRFRRDLKRYEFQINNQFIIGMRDSLEEAQRACEEHIITMVRAMLPAYRIVHQRVTGE